MQFGEVIFGGVGSGLYGMLIMAIITVFIAGLMVGRTPEYLGKKIEMFEMKMASVAVLVVQCTGQDRYGTRRGNQRRSSRGSESRTAWLLRNFVRLLISSE